MSKRGDTKKSVYILTEGQTEEAYFSRIKEIMGDADDWSYSVIVEVREIVNGSKTDPLNMVKEAKMKLKENGYNEAWVVFDKDRERDTESLKAFELARKSKIKIAFSSISFEQWILLHFEKSIKPFERSDCQSRKMPCTCGGDLCALTYIKQNYYPSYMKGKAKLYDELADKQAVALEYAAWLRLYHGSRSDFLSINPYTDVDVLVAYLLELPTIQFANLRSAFSFDSLYICINDIFKGVGKLFVSMLVTNNSNNTMVFNNAQTNINLIDKDNNEINYQILKPEIFDKGISKNIMIEFNINENFVISRLKFNSSKEIVFIEI